MKSIVIAAAAIAILGGALYFVLSPEGGEALGQGVPEGAAVVSIGELTANPEAHKGQEVTVKGTLAQVCPTTGCWGVLDDGTGAIRWESSAYGWALPPGKGGKEITVRGILSVSEEGVPNIGALGARL